MGSQIKFALRTLRSGGRSRSSYHLFGQQLRFALRVLGDALGGRHHHHFTDRY